MEISTKDIIYCTPAVEKLLPNLEWKCTESYCRSIFKNFGNLEMHLIKHHKQMKKSHEAEDQRLFFCPNPGCIYNKETVKGKHFTSIKYVRQHYQKVHAEKIFSCKKCSKRFISEGQLNLHVTKTCGRKFVCTECSWTYDSREALMTHGKRKNHVIDSIKQRNVLKSKLPKLQNRVQRVKSKISLKNKETQTDIPSATVQASSAQISPLISTKQFSNDFLVAHDMETQTEIDHPTSAEILDHMLYSNMCTQTCDEFLSELCLADIQTQTNWSAMSPVDNKLSLNSGSRSGGAVDELLVSTETQTSFTQCLLDSCKDENSFNNCTLTQHTQTCDTLLEGLFGSQENDLIGSFQSTFTEPKCVQQSS